MSAADIAAALGDAWQPIAPAPSRAAPPQCLESVTAGSHVGCIRPSRSPERDHRRHAPGSNSPSQGSRATIPTPDYKPGCRLAMHWRDNDVSASDSPISSGRAALAVGTPRATTPMAQSSGVTQRLLQELAVVQDQAEFERVLAAYRDLLESLSPQEHELLLEAVVDLRFEQAT
jgi:hypothetical protein